MFCAGEIPEGFANVSGHNYLSTDHYVDYYDYDYAYTSERSFANFAGPFTGLNLANNSFSGRLPASMLQRCAQAD